MSITEHIDVATSALEQCSEAIASRDFDEAEEFLTVANQALLDIANELLDDDEER